MEWPTRDQVLAGHCPSCVKRMILSTARERISDKWKVIDRDCWGNESAGVATAILTVRLDRDHDIAVETSGSSVYNPLIEPLALRRAVAQKFAMLDALAHGLAALERMIHMADLEDDIDDLEEVKVPDVFLNAWED